MKRGLLFALSLLAAGCSAAADGTSVLRTPGVHVVSLTDGRTSWLGPGIHPAWQPDGHGLVAETAQGPFSSPPAGRVHRLEVGSGKASQVVAVETTSRPVPSPSGRYLACLHYPRGDAQVRLVVLDGRSGQLVWGPTALGEAAERNRDQATWLPGRDVLIYAIPHDLSPTQPAGVYQLELPDVAVATVANGKLADGVWPSPDGQQVAVRQGDQVALVGVPGTAAQVSLPWPLRDGVAVRDVGWTRAGDLVLVTAEPGGLVLRRLSATDDGAAWQLPGQVQSRVGFGAGQAFFIGAVESVTGLWQVDLATGRPALLATIQPGVPIHPHPGWPAPAPQLSPEGRRLAVGLGRTDRGGFTPADTVEGTDVNMAGRQVKVMRRLRNVGPSGVVFRSSDMKFMGQAAPRPASAVVTRTAPGGMRWQRPSPARWVVLHHTATRSDQGSLNALTSPTRHKLAALYEDISPADWLRPEPGTLSVHYLVMRDGSIVQLVEEAYIARHAGRGMWPDGNALFDFNAETIGIEIVSPGNDYTGAQIVSVGRLVADICQRNQIPLTHIAGRSWVEGVLYHRDFAGRTSGKPDPAGWPWDQMMVYSRQYLGQAAR